MLGKAQWIDARRTLLAKEKELTRLRRENEILREERDILKKAAAWFAQEAVPGAKKRSDS